MTKIGVVLAGQRVLALLGITRWGGGKQQVPRVARNDKDWGGVGGTADFLALLGISRWALANSRFLASLGMTKIGWCWRDSGSSRCSESADGAAANSRFLASLGMTRLEFSVSPSLRGKLMCLCGRQVWRTYNFLARRGRLLARSISSILETLRATADFRRSSTAGSSRGRRNGASATGRIFRSRQTGYTRSS